MIRLQFAADDDVRRVAAFLVTSDEKHYLLDALDEAGVHESETEIGNLRAFVSYWTTQAEMLRLLISLDKEVEQYGIELARRLQS